jgi:hypothetical protein
LQQVPVARSPFSEDDRHARNAGAVAVVTDGMIRDPTGINRIGIPVFARGVISNSAISNGSGEIGLPASIGASADNDLDAAMDHSAFDGCGGRI